ncbi:MAG TPA: Gfo/Idh/MocA family oxidoreductase, partial [Kofleriaceae bacterium]
TRMLAELAGDLPNAVGLQARLAPSVRYARDLVAGGYVGEVLATTFSVSGISWTSPAKAGQAYLFDPANGATVLSIAVMHAMDALEYVLGPIAEGRVLAAMRRPTIELDNGERITNRGPDHLAVTATLASGALASVTARGGTSRTSGARWEIHGTEGDLVMTSPIGNFQVLDPVLEGGRGSETTAAVLPVPSTYELAPDAPTGFGSNVARL